MNEILYAFLLTTIAGLATGLGGLISLFVKRTNTKFLAIALGFSAGVMLYISMIEIFGEAHEALTEYLGYRQGSFATVAAFFGGIALIALIDKLVPTAHNPHEFNQQQTSSTPKPNLNTGKLKRMGILTAIAVAIHNFPEGIVMFFTALHQPTLAIPLVIAISIHNIPEGIAIATPIYYATGSRKKAVVLSFLAGLAEPLGAILAFLILMPFLNDVVLGIIFAAVAGIMVFISLDELLPAAREYGEHHLSIYGLIAGMAVMAISLLLLI